jgi:membrane protein DedA with SNARE-associated domain
MMLMTPQAITRLGNWVGQDRMRDMFDLGSAEMTHLLITYGYLIIFALVAIESMGIPVPGESTLLLASVYAGTTHHLSVVLVILAAAAGAVMGDNIGYFAGRKGGYKLLHRNGKHLHFNQDKLRLGQYLFDRHGGKVVFFGRFVALLRMWAAFLAGAHRMPWSRFMLFNTAGGVAWATLMGTLAYVFGNSILRLGGPIGIASFVAATLVMVLVGIGLRRGERRLQRQVDANPCWRQPAAA